MDTFKYFKEVRARTNEKIILTTPDRITKLIRCMCLTFLSY